MFINDIKRDFYDKLIGKQVLVLAHCDVDSVCACKILQSLFRSDSIIYTLIPVTGWKEVKDAFEELASQVNAIVMLNCGATIDIVETFLPPEHVMLFIADSRRPLDVSNVYRDEQVHLLMRPDEDDDVPAFEDVFREDESDEDEEDEGRENLEERLEKRRERRLWEENRNRILFDYTQFSFYGSSTAMIMFELAWKLSKDTNELLWWGIVGMTEQYLSGKVDNQKYILDCGALQSHVTRLKQQAADMSFDLVKISYEKELQLILYRHWSIMESLKHTPYTSCKFLLWTLKGERRCYEMLAELGIPLVQCRQKFQAMDVGLRKEVQNMLESKSAKYQLHDIVYGSFQIQWGLRHRFSAADYVFAANALLESVDKEKKQAEKFMDVLDCLSRLRASDMELGLDASKRQLIACYSQLQSLLHMHQVLSVGPFLYAAVADGGPDINFYSHPQCLNFLARWLLRAHAGVSRSRRSRNLPLVMSSPYVQEPGTCLITGIPPIAEDSCKNLFGKAFEQAGERTGAVVEQDYFDTSVIRLKADDRSKFLDALIALLN